MRSRLLITFIFLLTIVFSLYAAAQSSQFRALAVDGSASVPREAFTPSLAVSNHLIPGLQRHTYEAIIKAAQFAPVATESYTLVLYRLADNAVRVYFNDVLIGDRGDWREGNSNLWHSISTFTIDANSIVDQNVMRIETVAHYRTGMPTASVYLVPTQEGQHAIARMKFFGEQLITLMIGFLGFSAIITMMFYLINTERDRNFIYITVATLLTAVYCFDYLPHESIGMPYLLYKKVIMGSLFVSVSFYSFVISRYFVKNWVRNLGIVLMAGTVVMLILSPDMVLFKKMYTFWYFILLLNIFSWVAVCIINLRKRLAAYIFFITFMMVGLYGGITVAMDAAGSYFNFNSPVVYISFFAIVPVLLVYEAISEKDLMLVQEKHLKEQAFTSAMTDSLTGLWNQRYMARMFGEFMANDTFILMDIDNFKRINDTYGHLAGDYVLVMLSSIIKAHFRKTDIICRYGGDEFIIIMKDCNQAIGYRIFEALRHRVEHHDFIFEGQQIAVTISAGMLDDVAEQTVEQVFNRADALLYRAKAFGKNHVEAATESNGG